MGSVFMLWRPHEPEMTLYVVGAAPTGDAPTTSQLSTILLPTKVRLILETWRYSLKHITISLFSACILLTYMFELKTQVFMNLEYITVRVYHLQMRVRVFLIYQNLVVSVIITDEFFDFCHSDTIESLNHLLYLLLVDVWATGLAWHRAGGDKIWWRILSMGACVIQLKDTLWSQCLWSGSSHCNEKNSNFQRIIPNILCWNKCVYVHHLSWHFRFLMCVCASSFMAFPFLNIPYGQRQAGKYHNGPPSL